MLFFLHCFLFTLFFLSIFFFFTSLVCIYSLSTTQRAFLKLKFSILLYAPSIRKRYMKGNEVGDCNITTGDGSYCLHSYIELCAYALPVCCTHYYCWPDSFIMHVTIRHIHGIVHYKNESSHVVSVSTDTGRS